MKALITGITGQDGSYLAEHLSTEGWDVCGMIRGQANPKRDWIARLVPRMELLNGDLLDQSSLMEVLKLSDPDVVFNLGAITFVGMSWHQPTVMSEVTGMGCLRLLEAIRSVNPEIRLVQASTSEMFGNCPDEVLTETTPLRPVSPYGVAKAFAHHTVQGYRISHGLHACTAIMFNHESPRRGEEFVTRKITKAVARIAAGKQQALELGALHPQRDWGWAPDYVAALPKIALAPEPGDYVLATGETHSVRELCDRAFSAAGLDWAKYTVSSEKYYRPYEVDRLRGSPAKIRAALGWEPVLKFDKIVRTIVEHDLREEGL